MKSVEFDILMRDKTREAWQSVQRGAKQTASTVEQATADFKARMKEQSAAVKQVESDIKSLETQLKKAMPGAKKTELTAELGAAKKVLLEEKGALAELEKQFAATANKEETLRTQIAKQKQLMAGMTEGTKEYAAAMQKLGELQDRYGDINTQARIHSDDNKNIKGTMDAISGLTGAMTAGVGVASLFGAEQEKLSQIQTKLQAVMAITIGIQQVANTLNKDSFFTHTLLAKGKNLLTAANTRLAVSLGISNVAAKALMATLTLGLSAVIGGLIILWDRYSERTKKAQHSLTVEIEHTQSAMQQISNDVDFDTRIAEAAGKSKKELIELRKEVAKTALALADANYDKVLEQHSQGKATKEQLEKARENSLSAWDNYNKTMQDAIVADYEERTERKKKKDTADQTIDAISDAEVKARRKIEAMRIELMRDGAQKEKAEARKRLDDELTRIDAEERERIAALVKAKKNGIPVTKEQADTVTEQAKAQREGATNIYIKEFSEIEKKYTRQEKELWDEANAVFRSALENRLADIDRHYDEQIKKAEGNQALIDALNTSREKEKDTEKNIAKLEILDNAEQVELQRQAIVMQGLALDELAEVQRNNIIIRYARERIKILKTLGGERNKQEAAQLENMTKGLEKQNARRSLAGLFNEKTFKAVQGHFQKIYKDSDKAKEKTVSLFESIQKGGRLGAEGIGMLKSVFGGLDEDMDKALEAAGNIASGFAQGGIVGGALAAAGELVNFIAGGLQANKRHKEALKKIVEEQKAYLHEYRMLLLEEQLAYKSGTNIFGTDNIGRALNAIDTYKKSVVELKRELKGDAPAVSINRLVVAPFSYAKELKAYKDGIGALSKIEVKTGHKKTGLLGWGRGRDIYTSVLDMPEYKELIGKDGKLNVNMAKAILSTRQLKDESKKLLETLIDLQEQTDKAYKELEESLRQTFGPLGDSLTNSIVNAFNNGLDAAQEFKKGVTDVLADLAKQMVYSLFLKDKFDRLQENIKKIYTTEGLSEKEIARRTTDLIGGFFRGLGSQIDAANKFQEEFWRNAERNGFNRPSDATQQQARAGTYTAISQEQGTKLEGLFTSAQDHLSSIDRKMNDFDAAMGRALEVLGTIAANTAYCKLLEDVVEYFDKIERNGIKMA
ncbi:hypothetical protein HMPREF1981_02051 [Bacteroides pyogenes F0041]|uniref:Uncharacterized protein n=2 Tax=Bacteroides pyogenes TaxID=310300 RepID=U2C3W6_9BACE|nr:hypothetical protein [Bacteroides pyogenes]ERI85164.1 hypothetical protein HMPREF1981_02051 [Bacteroides pyogenes F0041]MBB3894403.1 hypothetical protein [Bacteroides pyogenes]SUV35499.1 Uncharacterised protein [Bacteroides pyogenes]